MTRHFVLRGIFALALGLFLSTAAQAQLFRTYISPDGIDGNPCTLVAPCRLLPAALATVIDGGEIWMLGSANYNTATVLITKSVTILAVPGALGSVVAIGGAAISINTPGVKVSLRNLVIVPFIGGGGSHGIQMESGTSLTVEKCLIANLPVTGISVSGNSSVLVTDTTIRGNGHVGLIVQNGARATVARATFSDNAGGGVFVQGNVASTTTADIIDSTIAANVFGLHVQSSVAGGVVKVSIRRSRIGSNTQVGVHSESISGAAVAVTVSNNIVSNNGRGVTAALAGARIWASGNTITGNTTGFYNSAGLLESAGDNVVRNNTSLTFGTITPVPTM